MRIGLFTCAGIGLDGFDITALDDAVSFMPSAMGSSSMTPLLSNRAWNGGAPMHQMASSGAFERLRT